MLGSIKQLGVIKDLSRAGIVYTVDDGVNHGLVLTCAVDASYTPVIGDIVAIHNQKAYKIDATDLDLKGDVAFGVVRDLSTSRDGGVAAAAGAGFVGVQFTGIADVLYGGTIAVGDAVKYVSGEVDVVTSVIGDPGVVGVAVEAGVDTDIKQINLLGGMKALGSGIFSVSQVTALADYTDGGTTSGTLETGMVIPKYAHVIQALVTDVTGFIGDTSAAMEIGDGTDADRYNSATDPDVFTTAAMVVCGAPQGDAFHTAEKTITLTITTAADFTSVTAGAVTVTVFFFLA